MSEIISRTFSFKKVEISRVTGHTFYDLVRKECQMKLTKKVEDRGLE